MLGLKSKKTLSDLFNQYTDESFQFSKTGVKVKLYHQDIDYVSRSQAWRILAGLEEFRTIEFDFIDIEFRKSCLQLKKLIKYFIYNINIIIPVVCFPYSFFNFSPVFKKASHIRPDFFHFIRNMRGARQNFQIFSK